MLSIRKATLSDCQTIRSLAEIVFPATYATILSVEQLDFMMEWMYSLPNLRKQMTEEGHTYFLAWDDDTPVGYVSVQQEEDDLFHLQKIYVLPDRQKHHIGEQLFQQAIRFIKEIHPTPCTMELNVNRQNPAIHFYERMGMTKAREGDFPIGNGFYMNDYIMAIRLFAD